MLNQKSGKFPKDFLWGSASAAYQVEGGWDADGKSPSVWDNFVRIPGKTFKGTTGDVAVDHYHRYEEDIALMAEMGLKTYRFSIAWSRIFPNNMEETNAKGIEFYANIIELCLENGIEPMVTLYHWDLPQYLHDQYGGWESREIIQDFETYATTLFELFKDKVKYWITINEQNIFTRLGWQSGEHPPGKVNEDKLYYQVNHHVFLSHAAAVEKFHGIVPEGKIGASFAYHPSYPASAKPEDNLANLDFNELRNFWWMDIYGYGRYPRAAMTYLTSLGVQPDIQEGDMTLLESAAGKVDFMGVNYYRTDMIVANEENIEVQAVTNTTGEKGSLNVISGEPGVYLSLLNPELPATDWDWTIDPMGLRTGCREITSRYNLPIIISENGLGAFDQLQDGKIHDNYRIEYIKEHLQQIKLAIDEGSEIISYCTWSFTDLLSWLNGYQKRYGFVYVDQTEDNPNPSLNRYKKDSYYWYQEVIETDGESIWN